MLLPQENISSGSYGSMIKALDISCYWNWKCLSSVAFLGILLTVNFLFKKFSFKVCLDRLKSLKYPFVMETRD